MSGRLAAAALAAAVVVAALWSASGLNTQDEAWFLQVVTRVAGGDVLYRDVFYGATPLAVWLTLPLVALLGSEILVVKAVVVACFAATVLLVAWIARRLGAGPGAIALLAAALLVWAPAYHVAPYQNLATVFLLACLALALAWLEREDGGRPEWILLAAAGAAAGLSFGAKQTVGAYALAALLGAIALYAAGRRVRAGAAALGGFAASALLVLLPVAATGGLAAFWDYGFANKGTYVARGGLSYPGTMRSRGADALDRLGDFPSVEAVRGVLPGYAFLLLLLVPLAAAGLAVALARAPRAERPRLAVVGLFTLAAAAAIFPRASAVHVSFVAPVFLVAAWCALDVLTRDLPDRGRRLAALAAVLVLLPAVAVRAAWPAVRVAADGARISGVPHLRGVLLEPERARELERNAAALAHLGAEGSLFLATPEAGLYYLLSGVENETPFDYPLVTAFGRAGEAELIADLAAGRFDAVCLRYVRSPELRPKRLVRFVATSLDRETDGELCTVFRPRRLSR